MIPASFAPHVPTNARLLIMGSLPGVASLVAGQYYAHPRNQFWSLMGEILEADIAAMDHEARLQALADRKIGLWDVVKSAERRGSLDAAIRSPAANDLRGLVAGRPDLLAVAFNGATAHSLGSKQLAGPVPAIVRLPSSSPAYAAMSFAAKRSAWLALRDFL